VLGSKKIETNFLGDIMVNLNENMKAKEELNVARKLYFQPNWIVISDNAVMVSSHIFFSKVNNNLFDNIMLDNDRSLIYIADIPENVGQVSQIATAIHRAVKLEVLKNKNNLDIVQLMNNLNLMLTKKNPNTACITFFVGILDLYNNMFKYLSIGHPPVILYNRKTYKAKKNLENDSLSIGISPDTIYKNENINTLTVDEDTAILLYTNGIFKCRSKKNKTFDVEHLLQQVFNKKFTSIFSLPDELLNNLENSGFFFEDDTTVILCCRESRKDYIISSVIEPKLDKIQSAVKDTIKVLSKQKISENVINAIELLLIEHLNNIVIHGYTGDMNNNPGKILLTVKLNGNGIHIRTLDKGIKWDCKRVSPSQKKVTDDCSGRGLNIIESIAEKVLYKRIYSLNESIFIIDFDSIEKLCKNMFKGI
jgi:anti-sigma regulatory factor (Ser/Thr protein kinase)